MNSGKKALIYFVVYYIFFYLIYFIIKLLKINEQYIVLVPFIIALVIVLCINNYIYKKEEKRIKYVSETSKAYKELIKLNDKYKFYDLNNYERTIYEKEYSHKAYDRARASDILIYHIENNVNNIRDFIINAYRNKKLYDIYLDELNKIINVKTDSKLIDKDLINETIFYKVEKQLINKSKINDNIYNISIDVVVKYITKSGNNSYEKNRIVNYQELCDLYMKWRNGKKYEETSRRERKYMNDKLRYDILKRDNFKCCKCGISANDGAKLHVDHIIPVSKGGKTTPSNLQTLCDRCNIGKSDKNN